MIETLLTPLQYEYMVKAILVSGLIGGVCAFLSCFVTLKGWSLMGDALSHAVVPGVAIAHIAGLPFAAGAFFSGMLAAAGMMDAAQDLPFDARHPRVVLERDPEGVDDLKRPLLKRDVSPPCRQAAAAKPMLCLVEFFVAGQPKPDMAAERRWPAGRLEHQAMVPDFLQSPQIHSPAILVAHDETDDARIEVLALCKISHGEFDMSDSKDVEWRIEDRFRIRHDNPPRPITGGETSARSQS